MRCIRIELKLCVFFFHVKQENAYKEWMFARASQWIQYFDNHTAIPAPFNLLPSAYCIKQAYKITFSLWDKVEITLVRIEITFFNSTIAYKTRKSFRNYSIQNKSKNVPNEGAKYVFFSSNGNVHENSVHRNGRASPILNRPEKCKSDINITIK